MAYGFYIELMKNVKVIEKKNNGFIGVGYFFNIFFEGIYKDKWVIGKDFVRLGKGKV